jgi:sec-independent protein translocase protein TatB
VFDFGFSELLLVAVVGLLVLGPERLPRAAKMAGLWVRRARSSWFSVKAQFERELADEELRRSLKQTRDEIDGLRQDLQKPFEDPTRTPIAAPTADVPAASEPPPPPSTPTASEPDAAASTGEPGDTGAEGTIGDTPQENR